jgi:hypothetical protein
MITIPKLFNTADMIDYLPHGPPDSSDDEDDEPAPVEAKKEPVDEEEESTTNENWQVVDETKKSRGVVRFVKWVFRRNP